MKVSPAQADRFAAAPSPEILAVLLYGPDQGLVRERATKLVGAVVEDTHDPFRVVELTGKQAVDDPARLSDEMAALALTGGRRAIRLRDPADSLAKPIADLLANPASAGLLVIEADDLAPRSALRKLFESDNKAAALPCYKDDAASLPAFLRAALAEHGLEVAPDALTYLASHLGEDRQLTRRELEKLVLYKTAPDKTAPDKTAPDDGPAQSARITLEDAIACVGDSATMGLDDIAFATASGDLVALERALQRCLQEGTSEIAAIRAVARHFQRLHLTAGLVAAGSAPQDAMRRLKPPVFWKLAEPFKSQLRLWQPEHLARALSRLLEAEQACKSSGVPADTVAARALLEVAANAPVKRRSASR